MSGYASLRSSFCTISISSAKLTLVQVVEHLSKANKLYHGYILAICDLVTQDCQISHFEWMIVRGRFKEEEDCCQAVHTDSILTWLRMLTRLLLT